MAKVSGVPIFVLQSDVFPFFQGRRVALRGAVPDRAAHPVRRLRPPHRREGRLRSQVRRGKEA